MNGDVVAPIKDVVRAIVPRSVRNWLRSPSRTSEWLWDSAKFSLGVRKTVQLAPDWSMVCHPRVYKAAQAYQVSDPEQREEYRNFISYCSADMLLFDAGAHFGIFSVAAACLGGRSVALDPSAIATRMIAIQARLNHCEDRIKIVRAAVSDKNGVMRLLSSGVFTLGFLRVTSGRPARELTSVPSLSIDHLTQQYGPPTHIKVDVEGHEATVLRGARETLTRHSPVLFLELHNELVASEGGDPSAVLDDLSGLGYCLFALSGQAIERSAILEKTIIRVVARKTATGGNRPDIPEEPNL